MVAIVTWMRNHGSDTGTHAAEDYHGFDVR